MDVCIAKMNARPTLQGPTPPTSGIHRHDRVNRPESGEHQYALRIVCFFHQEGVAFRPNKKNKDEEGVRVSHAVRNERPRESIGVQL